MYGTMLSKISIPETPGENPAPEMACNVVVVNASIGPNFSTKGFKGATKPAVEQLEIQMMKPGFVTFGNSLFHFIFNNINMLWVNNRYDQWNVLFSSVVFAFETTAKPASTNDFSISPATSASNPEKRHHILKVTFWFTFLYNNVLLCLW